MASLNRCHGVGVSDQPAPQSAYADVILWDRWRVVEFNDRGSPASACDVAPVAGNGRWDWLPDAEEWQALPIQAPHRCYFNHRYHWADSMVLHAIWFLTEKCGGENFP